MTGEQSLRAAVTGLIGLAATAEQELLADPRPGAGGSAEHWAAAPLVAHNTDFRRQQVQRLRAIRSGQAPPEFAEVDHASAALYAELSRAAPRRRGPGQLARRGRTGRGNAPAEPRGPA